MIVYPAIDLRGGRVVQLVGGRPEDERVRLDDDPVDVALRWRALGFRALHVVDLDAALGDGSNRDAIERVIAQTDLPVQVGGGVRDNDAVAALLDAGAERVIVGTRAIEDPAWLDRVSRRHPGRLVVAADVRGSEIVTRGWTERSGHDAGTLLEHLAEHPLAGVLVTDVGREGGLGGADRDRFSDYARRSPHALIASGGIRDLDDVRALADAGVAGAVIGMALYTGAIDATELAGAFAGAAPTNPSDPEPDA